MHAIGTSAAAGILRTDEPDHFGRMVQGGRFDYMQRPGQPFRATIRALRLFGITTQHVEIGASQNWGAVERGVVGLVLPVSLGPASIVVNGISVGGGDGLLLPGGTEFISAAESNHAWVSITLPDHFIAGLGDLASPTAGAARAGPVVTLAGKPAAELRDALVAATGMAVETPDDIAAEGRAEALTAALTELAAECLTATMLPAAPGRATRDAVRVFRRAEEALRSRLSEPIRRDDLCAMLGVSRRKLHDAFIATVGMSPAAYLKLRRMVLARRALRATGDRPPLVKSVALSHGFWHLGYFARDYRALFGETPSQTVAAGLPAWAQELA